MRKLQVLFVPDFENISLLFLALWVYLYNIWLYKKSLEHNNKTVKNALIIGFKNLKLPPAIYGRPKFTK